LLRLFAGSIEELSDNGITIARGGAPLDDTYRKEEHCRGTESQRSADSVEEAPLRLENQTLLMNSLIIHFICGCAR